MKTNGPTGIVGCRRIEFGKAGVIAEVFVSRESWRESQANGEEGAPPHVTSSGINLESFQDMRLGLGLGFGVRVEVQTNFI